MPPGTTGGVPQSCVIPLGKLLLETCKLFAVTAGPLRSAVGELCNGEITVDEELKGLSENGVSTLTETVVDGDMDTVVLFGAICPDPKLLAGKRVTAVVGAPSEVPPSSVVISAKKETLVIVVESAGVCDDCRLNID